MKRRQSGYMNIDFTGTFIVLAVAGAVSGIVVWELLAWVWPHAKAFIHWATG